MDALTPRDSPKRDDSMVTTTATAASAKPDAPTMSKEGIVHGHIHNYNNMTYIHGHLHHNAPVDDSGVLVAAATSTEAAATAATTDFEPRAGHDMGSCHTNEKCKEYADCQHFEFLNYHNNASLAKYKDTTTYNVNNNSSTNTYHSAFTNRTSTLQDAKGHIPRRKDSWFNDDLILLPSAKKNKLNSQSESDDCYCTPKILEICCDESHPKDEISIEQDKLDGSTRKSKHEDVNDVIIFTDVKNDHLMSNFNVHEQYDNANAHEGHVHNGNVSDLSLIHI